MIVSKHNIKEFLIWACQRPRITSAVFFSINCSHFQDSLERLFERSAVHSDGGIRSTAFQRERDILQISFSEEEDIVLWFVVISSTQWYQPCLPVWIKVFGETMRPPWWSNTLWVWWWSHTQTAVLCFHNGGDLTALLDMLNYDSPRAGLSCFTHNLMWFVRLLNESPCLFLTFQISVVEFKTTSFRHWFKC